MGSENSRISAGGGAPFLPTATAEAAAGTACTRSPSNESLALKRHHSTCDDNSNKQLQYPSISSSSSSSTHHHLKQSKLTPTCSPDIRLLNLGDQLPTPEQSRPATPPDIARRRAAATALLPEKDQLNIDFFDKIQTLGTGTFARVWLVRPKSDGDSQRNIWALKVLRKADVIKLKQVEHVRNERRTLQAASGHPFITSLITTFSDSHCLYMLLEYCPGGELFTYLRRADKFDVKTSQFYASEIVLILEFLHAVEGIAYRDLKPENLLLDSEGHVKLVDFGFAKQIWKRETYTLCGTPEYLAPEIIGNDGHGLAVDWWALGILIFEFLVGQPPFWDPSPMRIYELIAAGDIKYPEDFDPVAKDLVMNLCKVDPKERLGHIAGGAQRIKEHKFFEGVDWDDVYNKRTKPPIIPKVTHPADARNFDTYPPETTRLAPYTPGMRQLYEDCFRDF